MVLKSVYNESDLLIEVAKGNENAFRELFTAYHQQLGEYVLMLTQSPEMTEEIVQDVFVKVWLNKEDLKKIDRFTSYIFILTRNYTLNALRKMVNDQKRREQYNLSQDTGDYQSINDPQAEECDFQFLIDKAIAKLPPQQQKVFVMRLQGLKNPEIAMQMHISTDSVKKYQQWALRTVIGYVRGNSFIFLIPFFAFMCL